MAKGINPLKAKIRAAVSELAKREGLKSQVKIGDMRELMKKLYLYDSEFELTSPESPLYVLQQLSSIERAKRLLKEKKALRAKKK